MRQFLDKLIPTHIQAFEHTEERSRSRVAVIILLINAFATFLVCIASFYTTIFPAVPAAFVQAWFAFVTCVYVSIILLFKRTGNFVVCGNLFAFFWYVSVTMSIVLIPEPEIASVLLHFTVVPFYLAIIASYRSAIVWVTVFMITPVILNQMQITHFGLLSVSNWIGNCFGIFVAIYLSYHYREHMSQRLNKQNALLEFAAAHDALTGIKNRATFESTVSDSISHCDNTNSKSTLVYIDLDGFKQINDNYGHQSGDLVLKEVAQRLIQLTREHDTVARLGGDEFALILPGCTSHCADRLLERLAIEIQKPMNIKGRSVTVGCSFGCAEYPADGLDFEQLAHRADQRMYMVKRGSEASGNGDSSANTRV